MSRQRVGVIFGGRSVEHDVSIVTGHQVMEALVGRHEVVPIYITKEGRWLTSPGLDDLDVYRAGRWGDVGEDAFIPPIAGYGGLYAPGGRLRRGRMIPLDVVVPAIHGTFGEDGTLQGLLELADLPYVGSGMTGSAAGMDKVAMKACFQSAGLPVVPHTLVWSAQVETDEGGVIEEIERTIGYPAFVKPTRLGSSVGIGKATDRATLADALDVARNYDRRILVETAMEGCIEVNCSVIGSSARGTRASVCEQPVPWEEFLSFEDKYVRGGKGAKTAGMAGQERRIPAPIPEALTKQVQENAIRAFEAIDASGVARIDSFVRAETDESWVMEINTVPGSFSFYLWEATGPGVKFDELMDELIDIALETHRTKSQLMFTYDSSILQREPGAKTGG
ncbi:MAG: D-alanine--D-alanine ligase family protein [Actinomycetota bacterium]